AARDPDELRQPARRPLGEPAVRALYLRGLQQPAQREPGARRAGAHGLRHRAVAGARRDDRAARVHVRAAHAAHPPAPGAVMVSARTLERYLGRQIYLAAGFVLFGFLALFAFFY